MDTTKIFLHQIAAPGPPGDISAPEAAALRADQAAIDPPREGADLEWTARTGATIRFCE